MLTPPPSVKTQARRARATKPVAIVAKAQATAMPGPVAIGARTVAARLVLGPVVVVQAVEVQAVAAAAQWAWVAARETGPVQAAVRRPGYRRQPVTRVEYPSL